MEYSTAEIKKVVQTSLNKDLKNQLKPKKMKTIELIQEARNKVKEISEATKTLGHNDPNSVCFILNNKQDLVVTKIQTGWHTWNPCIYIGNYPMSKKEVIKRLDQLETLEKQFN